MARDAEVLTGGAVPGGVAGGVSEGVSPEAAPVDLVIFDCDGVLIDSEIISARMLIEALKGFGVGIDLAYVARHFLGRSYPTVLKTVRADFGIDLPPSFEEDYRARLLAAFERELRIMPGVREVLAGMVRPWCVATSSSRRRAEMSLDLVGLTALVGGRLYTAGEVAQGKPAPDLFLHAAARMGADPARCLVIEDSLNGIVAARAAGMRVWRFTGGSHLGGKGGGGQGGSGTSDAAAEEPEAARPDARFASFADFFQIAPDLAKRAGPET